MKVLVNGSLVGEVLTNRSLTLEEAMLCLGYDVFDEEDCIRGFENEIAGFYVDDMGYYQFDVENAEMIY